MQCFHPWKPDASLGLAPGLQLRCGRCQGCRLNRAHEWATRCMHEAQMHERNCYITLTYDDTAIPRGYSLTYPHFQKFMRRLRKHFKGQVVRFYMAGEYGDKFERPHFHACIFGVDFDDKQYHRKNQNGDVLYTSATLSRLWPHGFASVGAVTFQSAAYVARYVMKKITGDLAASHYTYVDEHGEIHQRAPEFNHMSLKPGIGKTWYDKFKTDIYPADHVITGGHPSKTPRYYDKLLEKEAPVVLAELKERRKAKAALSKADNTPRRLAAKEIVTAAKVKQLKRTLS